MAPFAIDYAKPSFRSLASVSYPTRMGKLGYSVHYASLEAVTNAYERELQYGGVYVLSEVPPTPLSSVEITLRILEKEPILVEGRVVNVVGDGFFAQFSDRAPLDSIREFIQLAKANAPREQETLVSTQTDAHGDSRPAEPGESNDTVMDSPSPVDAPSAGDTATEGGIGPALSGPVRNVWQLIDMSSGVPIGQQVRELTVAERSRLARQANRPVRAILIRDREKRIHIDVVKNPKTTDEEIIEWSGLSGISPLALKWISTQKRLMQNRTLQLNLIKNPMTPPNIALKLVKVIHISECRKIAKSNKVRDAIARVARKRVAEAVERM